MHIDGDLVVIGLTLISMLGMVTLGPIGRALAERLRGKSLAPLPEDLDLRLDDISGQLHAVQRQLGEVVERQDFSERLLAQSRQPGQLPAGEGT